MRYFRGTEPAIIDRISWHAPIKTRGAITDINYHVYIVSTRDYLPIGSGSSTRSQLIALGITNVDTMLDHYWLIHSVRPTTARSILAFHGVNHATFLIDKLPTDESRALKDLIAFSLAHKWFPGMSSELANDLIAIEITRDFIPEGQTDLTATYKSRYVNSDGEVEGTVSASPIWYSTPARGRALSRGGE